MTLDLASKYKWYPPPPDLSSPIKRWLPINSGFCEAWYDAEDASSITESSGQVSQWRDKSGYARHLNAGVTPEWGLGAQIDGKNVIDYAGTFDRLDATPAATVNMTAFALLGVAQPQQSGNWPAMGSIASGSGTQAEESDFIDARLENDDVDGRINAVFKIDDTVYTLQSSRDTDIRDDVPFVFALWYDGDEAVARINGGTVSVTNTSVPDAATFSMAHIQSGRETNTPENYHAEYIILSTADLTTIQKAEGYLAWHWGQADKLLAGHPYKSAWPTL